jgi:uncharacterized membrane protein
MAKTSAARGWLRIALAASIVLNIFFIALIGGHVLRGRLSTAPNENPLARTLANAEATLSPSDAAAFRRGMQSDAPHFEDAATKLAAARRAVAQQIAAEPFNADAVHQALKRWQMALNNFFDAFSDPLVDALAKVSPDGRRRLIAERQALRAGTAPPP